MTYYGGIALIAIALSAARLAIAWIEYREHRRPKGGPEEVNDRTAP